MGLPTIKRNKDSLNHNKVKKATAEWLYNLDNRLQLVEENPIQPNQSAQVYRNEINIKLKDMQQWEDFKDISENKTKVEELTKETDGQ